MSLHRTRGGSLGDPEVLGDLLQRNLALPGDRDDVVTKLTRIRLRHDDILPSEAEASQIRCQPNPGQSRLVHQRVDNDAKTPHTRPSATLTVAQSLVGLFNDAFNATPIDLGTLILGDDPGDQPFQPDQADPDALPPINTLLDGACATGGQAQAGGTRTAQTWGCGGEAGESSATSGPGRNVVYHNLRPDEDPVLGIFAQNPYASYMPGGHITNGSKQNFRSQYISTTIDIDVAMKWNTGRLVEIDLDKFGGTIIDASTQAKRDAAGIRGSTANRLAESSKEVLLVDDVPPGVIRWIGGGRP